MTKIHLMLPKTDSLQLSSPDLAGTTQSCSPEDVLRLCPACPSPSELMARVACFSNTVCLWSLLAELSWPGVVEMLASPWAANTEW
ncbi:hypothetical protein TGAM01_v200083 [Trichoderma gamsii]|uniref:Uncharacterized protein n=1 Tax=Trichoderma gamsii TaxID=398673 RepID=A0A2P5A296_9HYPO|nr:hypothetical protein TGAM01_v200083 [Trichoderma gamsii]PON30663.1 hypothetical protein TGAM01_v200083 [Trichoderma gamsii]